jgi:hypothetical protein
MVQNLPEVKPKSTLLRVSSIATPLQEASISNIPARAEASKAGTGSSQQPGNAGSSKQGETTTTGTYKETLTNIKVFKETCPKEKLTEGDQDSVLEAFQPPSAGGLEALVNH